MGTAILDQKSWGPPSWTESDVKYAKVGPILLRSLALILPVAMVTKMAAKIG